ncbi:MAG: VOC family protein [Lewinellaceae bacterium]|nr:VOC family protein [Saprospiraceae bacterium]MCB9332056.1 VOC family protein [Lewinellaceae bacterium]
MQKLSFSIDINAPNTRVWKTLWNDVSYRQWTAVFHEGSHAQSDWKEGSKILFLGPNGDGMSSRIARLIPNEFMSFEHLGEIKNGVEDLSKDWAGALENYRLRPTDSGTELTVEIDMDDNFAEYFQSTFPKALASVKALAEAQAITPFLWFDQQAEEAAGFYVSVFKNSTIGNVTRNGAAVIAIDFSLGGQQFSALNGGPHFKFNPAVSFYTVFETGEELDAAWQKLSDGGSALMPLGEYPWNKKYGWLQDRYGLSWQLALGKISEIGQRITPALMFTGDQQGRAEEAIERYSATFKNSATKLVARYEDGDGDPAVGTVKHAQFRLDGNMFIAMDSSIMHGFGFNEAVSFFVHCTDQQEVDYYWEKLTADGGTEGQCGWLKDTFGVSWQIVPDALLKLLSDPDPARAQRAMGAMMQMQKIDIAQLHKAADNESKTIITIQTTVAAPLEKVWDCWTKPEHVMHWNNASDDWHTPRAENDLRPGGTFSYRMEARDGSAGFDFGGTYSRVEAPQRIEYAIGDGRRVQVTFSETDAGTFVMESFEAETMHPVEMQRDGWQAILENFKRYAEGK